MRNLQDTIVDLSIVGRETRHQVIHKSIPPLPEITVCNNTDCLSQLRLYRWWHPYHESNQLALNRRHLILRKLVIAILICPIPPDEVLEEKGAR